MKIYCISLIKDEADIIEQTLLAALAWADKILVYDNGSEDGTPDIVRRLAAQHPPIVLYKVDGKPYSRAIRREPFLDHRDECADGDWWCILDGDEIYPSSPRAFLARVPATYQIVWGASIQYFLTEKDVARYAEDPARYADDVPVAEKVRYYVANWSEARFFRYDRRLQWPPGRSFPFAGAVYPHRIPMQHYQQRSPAQLQRRIAVRQAAIAAGADAFAHERGSAAWEDAVKSSADLHYDAGDGRFVIDEARLPPLPLTARLPPRLVNALRYWKGKRR